MVLIRALDIDGDFTFGNNKGNYISDVNALKQNIVTRLREYKNDCFFDLNSGIDYDFFLTTKQKQSELEANIKSRILQTEDVREILYFNASVTDRHLSIVVKITSLYGTFDVNLNI